MKRYELLHTRGYFGLNAVIGKVLEGSTTKGTKLILISGAELIKHGAYKRAYCVQAMYRFDADQVKEMKCNPLLL